MDIHPQRRDPHPIPSGVKAAVVIVVLGTLAAVADHAFFVAPHAQATPAATEATVPAAGDGFALPAELRPTQADEQAPPPTF